MGGRRGVRGYVKEWGWMCLPVSGPNWISTELRLQGMKSMHFTVQKPDKASTTVVSGTVGILLAEKPKRQREVMKPSP